MTAPTITTATSDAPALFAVVLLEDGVVYWAGSAKSPAAAAARCARLLETTVESYEGEIVQLGRVLDTQDRSYLLVVPCCAIGWASNTGAECDCVEAAKIGRNAVPVYLLAQTAEEREMAGRHY
ncbi:MAG: hypothetical protein ABI831_24940 [Betaproteobacteria bacterium]